MADESVDLYSDIKHAILQHFSFLKQWGFDDFAEEQLAYEYHFTSKSSAADIDIWFEAIYNTPIWIKINGFYIENLERGHAIFKTYYVQLEEAYGDQFNNYLNSGDLNDLSPLKANYIQKGRLVNNEYLQNVALLLQQFPEVLNGDTTILQQNFEIVRQQNETKEKERRIANKIYTLEYQFFATDMYDCYEEFQKLAAVKSFLKERPEIKVFRVVDWNNDEISI